MTLPILTDVRWVDRAVAEKVKSLSVVKPMFSIRVCAQKSWRVHGSSRLLPSALADSTPPPSSRDGTVILQHLHAHKCLHSSQNLVSAVNDIVRFAAISLQRKFPPILRNITTGKCYFVFLTSRQYLRREYHFLVEVVICGGVLSRKHALRSGCDDLDLWLQEFEVQISTMSCWILNTFHGIATYYQATNGFTHARSGLEWEYRSLHHCWTRGPPYDDRLVP